MKNFILRITFAIGTFWCISSDSIAADVIYEGDWHTTNRKLDGTMTCIVTEKSDEKWRGRFFGVWQGVAFDYTVDFAGPAEKLTGTAMIDGADYSWTGKIKKGETPSFSGSFGGSRYAGYFDLKEKKATSRR